MRIFVLEDDEAIGIGLSYTLESEKYEVTLVKTVAEAKKTVENEDNVVKVGESISSLAGVLGNCWWKG